MVRVTRQSVRKQQEASSTPTTNPSPTFSARTSLADSPPTSEGDQEAEESKVATTRTRYSRASSKRKAESEDLDSETSEIPRPGGKQAPKRRAVGGNRVYVEVPAWGAKAKGKTAVKSPAKNKGKAPVRPRATAVDDDDLNSDLEYDEDRDLDESDNSGSEFVASDDEAAFEGSGGPGNDDQSDADSDSEDEEALMLQLAVRNSLQANREDAGESSSAPISPAALRAAAAERRLTRANRSVDVDDSAMEFLDDLSSGSDDEPLSRRGKGKGKAKASADLPEVMTFAELRKLRKEAKNKNLEETKATRMEEKAMRKRLGRKLTYAEKSTIALHYHHKELCNVWGNLEDSIPVVVPVKADQPADIKLTLLPFQREGLYWMKQQEQGVWHGGMLADEMGMGKTIQIIALLLSDRKKPNLVIAPTVAIMQWKNEIETHTDGMKVLIWHGQARESDVKELKKYDVVLSTYAVLERSVSSNFYEYVNLNCPGSSFRKQEKGFERKKGDRRMLVTEKSPVHQIQWNRIILDEAHNIKERATNTAKAAFELQGNYRWCLSGTPLQNRVGELYSLVRFLGGDPFSYYFCKRCPCKSLHWRFSDKRTCDDCGHSPMQHTCFWNNEILTPIQKHGMQGPGKPAFKKLKVLLDRMMLRRTKLQRADDLGLPPRTVIVRRDYFSPEEKELYTSLFSDAKRQFNTYLDHGTILNNYSNIFSLLTRMRQMACHPDLVIRSKTNANKFIQEDNSEATVCRLCNDIAEDAIQSKCRHIFDRECIKQYLNTAVEQNPACPVCHLVLTIDLEAPALELGEEQAQARQGILGRLNIDTWRSSTKIEALVEELSNLRMQDATTKSLVFSQFVNFLDLIAFRLQKAGFTICRLEGTMSPQARDATIKHFMNNVDVTVFLVSLKAGGVALNLTEASRVYLMDSWWNPAVKAMDRIHRLGQHRPVKAIKLVVEDSIESRIVQVRCAVILSETSGDDNYNQLQEKKSAMVDATLSPDDSAMGRLTPADLSFLFRL
ncbi:SNF2 family N-terminal domain-containing protein [Armillaria novae-zelandiae]|uniref:SNF2 family N-terminal domain-containing protein n=1 Tax=Armillaria novae-zelandiae TaxID=153914 RepID=A0AA39PU84_9AGAR|nr:SNF2 family N-terminal domain-containing protein [Armillaria novae-zelandiae]